jgi:O86/O127-antigen biosynthesis beta-1,3-galactosyltransferase
MVRGMVPKISVLLAIKNGGAYSKECIESILNQSFRDFELIIIVNSSTDNTLAICQNFANKDDRIKVFESCISQLNYNLNLGLMHSSGEYLARIDADDVAFPKRFEKQVSELSNHDVIGSFVTEINEDGLELGLREFPITDKEIRSQIFYKTTLAHPSIMIKKDILLEVGGYQGGLYAQDLDLWLRLMRDKNISFYNIPEPLTKYRIHANQIKGSSLSFLYCSSYLFREAIFVYSLRYFIGSLIYLFKYFIR